MKDNIRTEDIDCSNDVAWYLTGDTEGMLGTTEEERNELWNMWVDNLILTIWS